MRFLPILLVAFFTSIAGYGQGTGKKIQIVLLGTFHLNQSLDSSSGLHSNLFTPKRQQEVTDLVGKLSTYKPDKIFVEREPKEQPFWDSLYTTFRQGAEPTKQSLRANEIVQLGFKTAKKLNLDGVICVDFQPENYREEDFASKYETEKTIATLWEQIEDYSDSVRTNAPFFDKRFPVKRPKQDSLLQKSTLSEFLINMNSPENYKYYDYSDWNWFYSLGRKDEYVGVDFLANFWYGRNLRIFANILRQVNFEKDQRYVLIYGASHMSFLKHLFESHPYFEVIPVQQVLK